MRYLRMLTNSVIAGAIGAAFVCVLVLQLNPHLPLSLAVAAPLFVRLALFYGAQVTVALYALIVLRHLFSRRGMSPGWLSLHLLAWVTGLLAGVASALMWVNLTGFRLALDPEAARRMAAGAAATAVCAVLLLIIGFVHDSFGRRGSRKAGALFGATVACALALPLVARGWGKSPVVAAGSIVPPPALAPATAPGRLVAILLDGASLEYVAPATAEGRLPNFGRLLDDGAAMHLTTIRPTQPATTWAAAATGKYPAVNGVRSAATYGFGHPAYRVALLPDSCFAFALVRLGILEERENDATAFRVRPLWDILSRQGISVGIVGWPLSDPVRPVLGYVVSDRVHRLSRAVEPLADSRFVYPADAFALTLAPPVPLAPLDGWGPGNDSSAAGPRAAPAVSDLLPRDVWYRRVSAALAERFHPHFSAMRYEGVDAAGHYYLRYAMPRAFGDVSDEERRRHGQVLARQYAHIDDEIGAALAGLGPDDVLLVISGFGMEPVGVAKRLLALTLGEPDLSGTHERGPDGFLIAYGGPVAAGRLPLGSIVDVAPTILYFLGLPIGRDMDGYARTDLFKRSFTTERPITSIPSYD